MILDIPRYWQKDRYSCGPRSLFCVAKYFDTGYSWREIKMLAKETADDITDGINQYDMKKLVHFVGLKYRTIKNVTFRKIKNSIEWEIPIICTIDNGDHWIVIKGYDSEYIYINDPVIIAKQKYYIDDFLEIFDAEEAYAISY